VFARPQERTALLLAVLLQPASLLVDHGHFQYNCISLGLSAAAAAAVAAGTCLRPFRVWGLMVT
jgi:alpha-1,3-glucosyltransferase